MSDVLGRKCINIVGGGCASDGHAVTFVLEFEGGTRERVFCDYELMPLLVGNLTHYASMAAESQTRMPQNTRMFATPYHVTKLVRSGHSPDGRIVVLELDTNHGFPLQIAMTPEQSRQTIEALQIESLEAAPQQERPH